MQDERGQGFQSVPAAVSEEAAEAACSAEVVVLGGECLEDGESGALNRMIRMQKSKEWQDYNP